MRIDTWVGDAASARVRAADFRGEWELLYAECPWASVFQSHGYVSTWYEVYRSRFTPLIVTAVDDDGRLCGLLPLALDGRGNPVAAGARQAEYQGWIARPGDDDRFIVLAFERLAVEYAGQTLTLRYLPPGAPLAWARTRQGIARRCDLQTARRGVLDLSDGRADAALAKKSNRQRMKRLERMGPVAYERLTDPVAIDALLEQIAPMCDLRNGALHGVLPFGDDPLKLPFHRALARVPGALYVSVLRCGEEIASAEFNADNRGQVALGFGAMSPRLAQYSPGRLHLLHLAQDLARQGRRTIDLTPGDAPYKDLLTSHTDEVQELRVFFGAGAHAVWRASRAARRGAKDVVRMLGGDPAAVRDGIARLAARLRNLKARRDAGVVLYDVDAHTLDATSEVAWRVDSISDLVAYRPGLTDDVPRQAFLRRALSRLERGAHVYTRMRGGDLVSVAWVSTSRVGGEENAVSALPGTSLLVHDVLATQALRRVDEWARSLPPLLRDAAQRAGTDRVLLAVPDSRADLADAVRQLGAKPAGSLRTDVESALASPSPGAVRAAAVDSEPMRPVEVSH